MPKIRIAQIVGNPDYGVGSVVLNYFRKIDKELFDVDFYTYGPSPRDQEIIAAGGRVFFMKSFKKPLSASRALYKLLSGKNYNIVHSHLNTLNGFALRAAEKAGVPVRIAHNHSTSFPFELSSPVKFLLKGSALKHATHAAACSLSSAKWIYGRRAEEAFILPNAVDAAKYTFNIETRERLRRELNLGNAFAIGHVGRFVRQKNHSFVIDTMERIHSLDENAVLLLAGDGKLMGKIRKKAEKAGLSDSVIFLGARRDMENLYQVFDVFILPSHYEGLPLSAVEAQAAGLPVVLSDKITAEVVIAHAERISLKANWTDTVLSKRNFERTDTSAKIRTAGFDILTEVKKLEEYYKKLI